MIPKNVKAVDCVGKYATTDKDIRNKAGHCISAGSLVKIVEFGRAFSIETEKCPLCGQYAYIRGVKKCELTLCIDSEAVIQLRLKSHKGKYAIINKVSQFLQDAGFEEASKAIDCKWDL